MSRIPSYIRALTALILAGVILVLTALPRQTSLSSKNASSEKTKVSYSAVRAFEARDNPKRSAFRMQSQALAADESPIEPQCREACSIVDVGCVSPSQIGYDCGPGAGACMDGTKCELEVTRQVCRELGLHSKTYFILPLVDRELPKPLTLTNGNRFCELQHELVHARQNTCNTTTCQRERGGYTTSVNCMAKVAQKICAAGPNTSDCEAARAARCFEEGILFEQSCRYLHKNCDCDGCRAEQDTAYARCMKHNHISDSRGSGSADTELLYCHPTPTSTPIETIKPSETPSPTSTTAPTTSASPTATASPTASAVSTATATSTPTATSSPMATLTATPTPTPTQSISHSSSSFSSVPSN